MKLICKNVYAYKASLGDKLDNEPCEMFDDKGYESVSTRVLNLLRQGQQLDKARRGEIYDVDDDFEGDPEILETAFDEADEFEKCDLMKDKLKHEIYLSRHHQFAKKRQNETKSSAADVEQEDGVKKESAT